MLTHQSLAGNVWPVWVSCRRIGVRWFCTPAVPDIALEYYKLSSYYFISRPVQLTTDLFLGKSGCVERTVQNQFTGIGGPASALKIDFPGTHLPR